MKDVWTKLYRGLLTEKTSEEPQTGVWIRHLTIIGDHQHTVFHIAIDSSVCHTYHCYCGEDRSRAYSHAKELSLQGAK